MGIGMHAHIVHLIDFGLAKEFRDPDTNQHIPYTEAPGLTGTAVFASIHSHLGVELGRRDDLESLAYVLIYFLRGSLPWQGMQSRRRDLVVRSKQRTSIHDLCLGLPTELYTFLKYTRSLSFDDKPDYGYLCGLFDNTWSRDGFEDDPAFDWESSACDIIGQPSEKLNRPPRETHPKRRTG
jgi:serine/threonine protein kinase